MTIVMKSYIYTIVISNSRSGNDGTTEVTTYVFCNNFGITSVRHYAMYREEFHDWIVEQGVDGDLTVD